MSDASTTTLSRHRWQRSLAALFCVLVMLACLLIGARTTPLRSPDEHAHLARAYTLLSGEWLMGHAAGRSTSARLDSALADYLRLHRQNNRARAGRSTKAPSLERLTRAGEQRLGGPGIARFEAPGAALYPPIAYLPQASALATARVLGLPLWQAYGLARLLALLASVALLWLAFQLVIPSPLQLTLLALPMSLFQLASASLDGVTNSLAVLLISAYLVFPRVDRRLQARLHLLLILGLLVLVPVRLHLWPLLVLPLFTARVLQRFWAWASTATLGAGVFLWVATVSHLTLDLRAGVSRAPLEALRHFLQHPDALIAVILRTVSNPDLQRFYGRSFIGVLGWLDQPLESPLAYHLMTGLIVATLLLPVIWVRRSAVAALLTPWRLSMLALALLSSFSVFALLLLAWTPNPATAPFVDGVQGRYFLIPAVLLAFALAPEQPVLRRPSSLLITYGSGCAAVVLSTVLTLRVL